MEPAANFDEIALLKRLKEGDSTSFIQLYDHYHHQLYVYILKFVKVPEYAEDILQDVFLKIWEIRERINPELSFNAYLYKITRNKVFKLLKKIVTDDAMQTQLMNQLEEATEAPHLKLQWKMYNDLLNKAVNQLPPQRQKVFKLCREQGKSYDEAAAELGISRNTIKEHMVAAMKSVKEYIFQHGELSLMLLLVLTQKK
jgi:RNA polymerase sigma-70 factor (family 1)